MKTFYQWYKEVSGKDISGQKTFHSKWFVERGLPMVVKCTCCELIMPLPVAFVDERNYLYCSTCANES